VVALPRPSDSVQGGGGGVEPREGKRVVSEGINVARSGACNEAQSTSSRPLRSAGASARSMPAWCVSRGGQANALRPRSGGGEGRVGG